MLFDEARQVRRPDGQPPPEDDLVERVGERTGARPAEGRIPRQSPEEHRAHVVGQAPPGAIDGRQVRVTDAQEDVELLPAAEERPQDEHLGKDDPEREDVAAGVEVPPDDLLGRHVAELAFELTRVGPAFDSPAARAIPKSVSFTVPVRSMMTLPG